MSPHYDPPSGLYTQSIPPGTAHVRQLLVQMFGFTRTEVVRDRSRCNAKGSEHCECRAIDAFTTDIAHGNEVFEWAIANAERYGIQSVIWRDREWGFGDWRIRHREKKDHYDHVHIGLNKKGAGAAPQEEDMTPEEHQMLEDATERLVKIEDHLGFYYGPIGKALYKSVDGEPKEHLHVLESIVVAQGKQLKAILDALGTLQTGGVDTDALAAKLADNLAGRLAG